MLASRGFYSDSDAVTTAMQQIKAEFKNSHPTHPAKITDEKLAEWLYEVELIEWKLSRQMNVKHWAEALANEILPLAR